MNGQRHARRPRDRSSAPPPPVEPPINNKHKRKRATRGRRGAGFFTSVRHRRRIHRHLIETRKGVSECGSVTAEKRRECALTVTAAVAATAVTTATASATTATSTATTAAATAELRNLEQLRRDNLLGVLENLDEILSEACRTFDSHRQ